MRWLFVLLLTLVAFLSQGQTLTAVLLDPPRLTGGSSCSGLVTLSSVAPAKGVKVDLVSSDSQVVSVPASVTIPGGAWSAKFAVSSSAVTERQDIKIEATDGDTARSVGIEIQSPILSSFVFTSSSVIGGASSTGKITLNGRPRPEDLSWP
jgi:hypothetical protein